MIDTLPKLENLTPLVAIVLLFLGWSYWQQRQNSNSTKDILEAFEKESQRNAEAHKQKSMASLEDNVRKDAMIADLTRMTFDAMERNTQAFITNTEMTKKVMESIDRLRSEIFNRK